jgi:hypothetical protein
MSKKNSYMSLCFVSLFLVSIGLNVLFVERYDILGKLQYKASVYFDSSPKVLSEPIDLKEFYSNPPAIHYLTKNSISKLKKSLEKKNNNIPNQLIIKPGIYNFQGTSYDLTKEGLYRFKTSKNIRAQRIVFQKDIEAFLSAISWITSHGSSDIEKTVAELTEKAMHSKLLISCGPASNFTQQLLATLNIKSRLVSGITLELWNGYNDGHALIEVWREKWGKWVLYDINLHSYFTYKQGSTPLSLFEFHKAVAKDDFLILPLSLNTSFEFSHNPTTESKNNFDFFTEESHVNIRDWYRWVMQVPLIFNTSMNKMVFTGENSKERIESLSDHYQHVDAEKFINMFYKK